MKKAIWAFLAASMVIGIVGCSAPEEEDSPTPTSTPAATQAVEQG